MNKNIPFIPQQVEKAFTERALTPIEYILYINICRIANCKEEICFAKNEHLAARLGASIRTVEAGIMKLKKLKFIKGQSGRGGVRRELTPVYLPQEVPDPCGLGCQEVQDQVQEVHQQVPSTIEDSIKLKETNTQRGFGLERKEEEEQEGPFQKSARQFSIKLIDGLIKKRKLLPSKLNNEQRKRKWTKQFVKFFVDTSEDPTMEQRAAKVLDWYVKNIGNPYIPQAYSSQGFIDKFIKIENAMNRTEVNELRPMTAEEKWDAKQKTYDEYQVFCSLSGRHNDGIYPRKKDLAAMKEWNESY